ERLLESHAHSQLRGERNAYRCAGAEEISQCALGYLKLLQAGDGRSLRAVCNRTNTGDVGDACDRIRRHLGQRNRQLGYVDREVRAGVVPVEDIEELDKWIDLPALVNFDGTRNAQVGLDVRRAAKYVQAGVSSVHIDAVGVVQVRDGDGAGALELADDAQLETAGKAHRARQHE